MSRVIKMGSNGHLTAYDTDIKSQSKGKEYTPILNISMELATALFGSQANEEFVKEISEFVDERNV